jgi:hypothetical protein
VKNKTGIIWGLLVVLLLAGCLPSAGYNEQESRAGFWWGIWHGAWSPLAFLVSIFDPTVRIYESCNHRVWYDLGFVIGLSFSGWFSTSRAGKQ